MKARFLILALLGVASAGAQPSVRVSGRVMDAADGLPVEGAAVWLIQGGAAGSHQLQYTDSGGGYSFDEIAAGAASVEITASGFLAFQKTNPDEASIRIAPDSAVHNFRLTRSATLTGRISTGQVGGADRDLVTRLYREDFSDGIRHFVAGAASVSVNQSGMPLNQPDVNQPDGSFTFAGLEPGRYIVSVGPRQSVSIPYVSNDQPKPERQTDGWVQTYYPGTSEFSAAISISLTSGETRAADFNALRRPLFRASGVVNAPQPEAWDGTVSVASTGDGPMRLAYSGPARVPGTFTVDGLRRLGEYVATTIIGRAEPVTRGGMGISFSMRTLGVNLAFTITDHDVEGLTILPVIPAARPPFELAGTFQMANPATPLPAGLAVQYSFPQPGGQSDPIPAAPNGQFWLNGGSGDYSVRTIVPSGYTATAIRYGGGNYLNSLLPLNGGTPDSSLTIVLSDQPGSVTGTLVDGNQKPVAAKVVLAPDSLPANFDFRALRVGKTDDKGAFVLNGVAPGSYKAIAMTGDDRNDRR